MSHAPPPIHPACVVLLRRSSQKAESGKAFAICGIPKPDEAMNNIVNPRNASSETRRSGRVAEPEGVLIRRESAEGDTLARGHVDTGW